jgi:hypothetical protein
MLKGCPRSLGVLAALLVAAGTSFAQGSADAALFEALKKADSSLFDEGFNRCNMQAVEAAIHPEIEFLHDQSGRERHAEFMKSFREFICSSPDRKPIRRLVEGSLEAYPLKNEGKLYGAVQMGRHDFYIAEPGKEPRRTATARFVHTWLLEGGRWKLYRVISYDHQPT